MTIEKRLKALEDVVPPSGPKPSGIALYNIRDADGFIDLSREGLIYETGMQRLYSEAELAALYKEHPVFIQIRMPDNGREPLEVIE